jgi:hypothetical protein
VAGGCLRRCESHGHTTAQANAVVTSPPAGDSSVRRTIVRIEVPIVHSFGDAESCTPRVADDRLRHQDQWSRPGPVLGPAPGSLVHRPGGLVFSDVGGVRFRLEPSVPVEVDRPRGLSFEDQDEICGDRRPGKPRATVEAEAIMGRLADEDASGRPRVAFFNRAYLTGARRCVGATLEARGRPSGAGVRVGIVGSRGYGGPGRGCSPPWRPRTCDRATYLRLDSCEDRSERNWGSPPAPTSTPKTGICKRSRFTVSRHCFSAAASLQPCPHLTFPGWEGQPRRRPPQP